MVAVVFRLWVTHTLDQDPESLARSDVCNVHYKKW